MGKYSALNMDDDDDIFGEFGGYLCSVFWKLLVAAAAFGALAAVIFQPAFLFVNVPGVSQATNNGDSPLQLGGHMLVNTDGDVVFRDNQTSDVWSVKNTREQTLFSVTNTGSVAIAGTLSGGEDGVFFLNGTKNGIVLQGNDLAILAVQDGQVLTAKNTLDDSQGNAGVANNINVGGNVAAATASVAGDASVGGTLTVAKLNVTGSTQQAGLATFGSLRATNSIKSDGTIVGAANTLDDGVGNTSIVNNLTVGGNAVVTGNLTVTNLNVITFTKVNVDTINVTGDASFQSITSETSITAAHNTLDDGAGNAGIVGTLTAHGPVLLNSTVTTSHSTLDDGSGNAVFGGSLTAVNLNLPGNISINGTLYARSGISTLRNTLDDGVGGASVAGTLTVQGATLLNGTTVNTRKNLLDDGQGNANIAGTLSVTNLSVTTFTKINVDVINVNGGAVFQSLTSNSTLSAAQNTLDDGSGNVNVKGNIVMSAGSSTVGLMPAQAASSLGGVYMDSGFGNLHFAGGPTGTESWNVIDQNGATQFKVYNSPLGSVPQRGVKTYANTLDDGKGNVIVTGTLTQSSITSLGSGNLPYTMSNNDVWVSLSASTATVLSVTLPTAPVGGQTIVLTCSNAVLVGTKTLIGATMWYNGVSVTSIPLTPMATYVIRYNSVLSSWHVMGGNTFGNTLTLQGTSPVLRMTANGFAPPANSGTLSAGAKFLPYDDGAYLFGIGIDQSTQWYASTAIHKFYYYNASGNPLVALTLNAKAITTGGGNTVDDGSGNMIVAGSSFKITGASPLIRLANTGLAPPANMGILSVGAKVLLWDDGNYDYAIGVDSSTTWYSSGAQHKFYYSAAGTRTLALTINAKAITAAGGNVLDDGTGNMNVAKTLTLGTSSATQSPSIVFPNGATTYLDQYGNYHFSSGLAGTGIYNIQKDGSPAMLSVATTGVVSTRTNTLDDGAGKTTVGALRVQDPGTLVSNLYLESRQSLLNGPVLTTSAYAPVFIGQGPGGGVSYAPNNFTLPADASGNKYFTLLEMSSGIGVGGFNFFQGSFGVGGASSLTTAQMKNLKTFSISGGGAVSTFDGSTGTQRNVLDDGTGKASFAGQLTLNAPMTTSSDIYFNSATRRTIGPSGNLVVGNVDIQLSSANQGTVWLNQDSKAPVKTGSNIVDDGSGNAYVTGYLAMRGGAATTPATLHSLYGAASIIIQTSFSSPQSGRVLFGDGSGWQMSFSTKLASSGYAYRDLINITDGGKITTAGGNTLDDGSGNVVIAGNLNVNGVGNSVFSGYAVFNGNANFPAGKTVNFGSGLQISAGADGAISIWDLKNSVQWLYRNSANAAVAGWISTKNNLLDNGSGAMTVTGTLTVSSQVMSTPGALYINPSGTNRLALIVNSNSITTAGSGNAASVNVQENGITYWEIINFVGNKGTYSPTTDMIRFWYDGTGSGSKLQIYGSGKITTVGNNVLDDSTGNMVVAGTLTMNGPSFSLAGLKLNVQPGSLPQHNGLLGLYYDNATAYGAFISQDFNSMILGVANSASFTYNGVAANTYSASLRIGANGYVGTTTGTYLPRGTTPTFRNILDDSTGNMVVAGTLTQSSITSLGSGNLPYQMINTDVWVSLASSVATVLSITLPVAPVGGQTIVLSCTNSVLVGTKTLVGGTMWYNGVSVTTIALMPMMTYILKYNSVSLTWSVMGGNTFGNALYVSGTNPVLRFQNSGIAPPGNSGVLSAGMKIMTYDDGVYEFGIGIDSGTQWYMTGVQHKFYYLNAGVPALSLTLNSKVITTGGGTTLDDGSGNMVVAGSLRATGGLATAGNMVVNPTGTSRLTLAVNSNAIAAAGSGFGATLSLLENNVQYWEFINSVGSKGTFSPANDNLNFWYDGTNPGGRLVLYGSGKITTMGFNQLDDGNGNIIAAKNLGASSAYLFASGVALPYATQANATLITNQYSMFRFVDPGGAVILSSTPIGGSEYTIINGDPGGNAIAVYPPLTWEFNRAAFTDPGANNPLYVPAGGSITFVYVCCVNYYFAITSPLRYTGAKATSTQNVVLDDGAGNMVLTGTSGTSTISGGTNTWMKIVGTDTGSGHVQLWNNGQMALNTFSGSVWTGGGTQLDDSTGNMVVKKDISAATTNTNFHIAPTPGAGNRVGFSSSGKTAWGLVVTENGAAPKANTFVNQLDDGTGNVAFVGTSTTPLTVLNSAMATSTAYSIYLGQSISSYNAAVMQFFYSAAGSAANNYFRLALSGNSALTIYGNGKIVTQAGVTLDDGGGYLAESVFYGLSISNTGTQATAQLLGNQYNVIRTLVAGSAVVLPSTVAIGTTITIVSADGSGIGPLKVYPPVGHQFSVYGGSPWSANQAMLVPIGTSVKVAYVSTGANNRWQIDTTPMKYGPTGAITTGGGNTLDDGSGRMVAGSLAVVDPGTMISNLYLESRNTQTVPNILTSNGYAPLFIGQGPGGGVSYSSTTGNFTSYSDGSNRFYSMLEMSSGLGTGAFNVYMGSGGGAASLQLTAAQMKNTKVFGVANGGAISTFDGSTGTVRSKLDDGTGAMILSNYFQINQNVAGTGYPIIVFNPGLVSGNTYGIGIGYNSATLNTAQLNFGFTAAGSTSNTASLQVSGHTGVTVNGVGKVSTSNHVLDDGTTGAVALNMNSATSTIPLTIYNSGMGASTFSTMVMGKDNGAFNTGQIQFAYAGAGSTSNAVSLQVSSRSGLTITGTGRITTFGNAGNVLDDGSGSMTTTGFPIHSSIATGIVVTGATAGAAAPQLTKAINVISTNSAGAYFLLPTATVVGTMVRVINNGASGQAIAVAPSAGTINGFTSFGIAQSGNTNTQQQATFIYIGSNNWVA